MKQPIVGFHQDEEGHWVAELACGHTQHVRHAPPLVSRPWVTTGAGRAVMLGHELPCARCAGTAGAPGWRRLDLGDATLADAAFARAAAAFAAFWERAGRPAGTGLFVRHESDGGLHCRLRLYYPPAAAGAAEEAGAEPCPRPEPGDLGIASGSPRAGDLLFPEE